MIRSATILIAMACLAVHVQSVSAQKFLQRTAAEWTSQLKSADAAARRNAAFALGKMGNFAEASLPALKQALKQEKDAKVREAMVCAAGEIVLAAQRDNAEMEAMLVEAARDPNKYVRRSAALSLGQIGAKSDAARAALANALKDEEQIVRQNAAWALGQLDDKACAPLVGALADATSDSLVKRDAANALLAVGKDKPSLIRPALNHLLAMCEDPDPEVRKAALAPLVKIVDGKDEQATRILKTVLSDADPEVRRYAALALSNVGGESAAAAVPILLETLRNGEPHLKKSAALALHNVGAGAASAVPDLIKLLQDPDPDLRKYAALGLGGIGKAAASAVPALVQILGDANQTPDVRIEAAESVTLMGNVPAVQQRIPEILKVLGNAGEDGNLRVRLAWLFNAFIQHDPTMTAARPVMDRVCAERENKANGSTRYHCAYLLGIKYGPKASDAALDVLEEWLFDNTGKLYGPKKGEAGLSGAEKQGKDKIELVLTGDSRVMAVDALRIIGRERVRARPRIADQLGVLVKDKATHKDLRESANNLLSVLGK